MRPTIIAANWKMNGDLALLNQMNQHLAELALADDVNVVLNVPFPFLFAAENSNKNVAFGAQNMSEHDSGAFTGEISAAMLKEFNVDYVVLGHSERRSMFKESSHLIALKVQAALNSGLTPILCIGETESERDAGETQTILAAQLQPVIDVIGIEKFKQVVIAYEPVWAIGTGNTASPEMAQETHHFIRQFLASCNADVAVKIPLLYGGSMNATNCKKLLAQEDIDGGLIGGASLKVEDFSSICLSA